MVAASCQDLAQLRRFLPELNMSHKVLRKQIKTSSPGVRRYLKRHKGKTLARGPNTGPEVAQQHLDSWDRHHPRKL